MLQETRQSKATDARRRKHRQVTSDTQPATSLLCGQMAAPVTVGWLSLPVLCCMPACTRAPRHLLSDKALSPIHLLETHNLLLQHLDEFTKVYCVSPHKNDILKFLKRINNSLLLVFFHFMCTYLHSTSSSSDP